MVELLIIQSISLIWMLLGKNTYNQEVLDIGRVIDHLLIEFENQIDTNHISLIGHSRGGGIVLLRASNDHRITSVVTWAGVSDFKSRFPDKENLLKWKNDGVRYILNSRTKQNMPHYYSFYEDFIKNENKLNISKAVKTLAIPQLIIHGTQDEAVLINEAYDLKKWNPLAQLVKFDTNHTFGTKHPWHENQLPEIMSKVVDKSIYFINNYNT